MTTEETCRPRVVGWGFLGRGLLPCLLAAALSCGGDLDPPTVDCSDTPDGSACPVRVLDARWVTNREEHPGKVLLLMVFAGAPRQSFEGVLDYSYYYRLGTRPEHIAERFSPLVPLTEAKDGEPVEIDGNVIRNLTLDDEGVLGVAVEWDSRGIFSTCWELTLRIHVGRAPTRDEWWTPGWRDRTKIVSYLGHPRDLMAWLHGSAVRLAVSSTTTEVTRDDVVRVWARSGERFRVEAVATLEESLLPDGTIETKHQNPVDIRCTLQGTNPQRFDTRYEKRDIEWFPDRRFHDAWVLEGSLEAGAKVEFRCGAWNVGSRPCDDFWNQPLGTVDYSQSRATIIIETGDL